CRSRRPESALCAEGAAARCAPGWGRRARGTPRSSTDCRTRRKRRRAPNASMAYWGTMRRICWLAVSLALAGCSEKDAPPKPAAKIEKTPDVFQAVFDTSKGKVAIEVHRDWAPIGGDHFYSLIQTGVCDGVRVFRVTRNYVQFGINGDPATSGLWSTARLTHDKVKVKQSNVKG